MVARYPNRSALVILVLAILLSIALILQMMDTTFHCPVRGLCLTKGLYKSGTILRDPGVSITEARLREGSVRYDQRSSKSRPNLIILALDYDESSWDRSYPDYRRRTEEDFFDLISQQVNLTDISIGVLTASKSQYEKLKQAALRRSIGRMTVIFRPHSVSYSYDDRHEDNVQYERRANIATLRNFLMFRALEDEEHLFWLDADVVDMSPNLIKTMIKHAEDNDPQIGIITARCQQASMPNYDLNAWAIDRTVEQVMLSVPENGRQALSDTLIKTRKYVPDQIKGLNDDEIGSLDSVGGTGLYIRANLIHSGVNFPYFKIVGTTWALEGWAGQETEGICYMARRLNGAGCWALGGSHYTRHAG